MNFNRILELAGLPPQAPATVIVEAEAVEVVETEAVEAPADAVEVVADLTDIGGDEVVVEAEAADEAKEPVMDLKAEAGRKKVKVPADVLAAITQRIAELKASVAEFNEKGYDDAGVKPNAIDALEQIKADLALEDGLTVANIFYGTLMSPITDLFPPKVVKFLHTAPDKKKVTEAVDRGSYYIYSIFPGDGSKMYCSTVDGARAEFNAAEVKQQLAIFNRGGKTIWHAESTRPIEVPTRGEDRPGSGFERYSDDTAERDGPDYDDDRY